MTPPERPQIETIKSLEPATLIRRYAVGVENLDPEVLQLDDQALDTAFQPDTGAGRWPVRVLLGHLADAEMVLVMRMRRIVAEDGPVLSYWDEHAFIDGGVYTRAAGDAGNAVGGGGDGGGVGGGGLPIAGSIAVIHTLRKWMEPWLGWLEPAAWARSGLHEHDGPQTLHDIASYATWHLEHHAWYLARKLERLPRHDPAG